ncbi:MAG: hypothetical protein AAF849_11480 [Bacteroidota bacterium]
MNTQRFFLFLSTICLAFSCDSNKDYPFSKATVAQEVAIIEANKDFNDYWYAGKAEVSSYELKQARYGEIHDGDAVLIFVTEPFSLSKQVKLDYPENAGKDKVSVLKLNHVRKFNTGIYDYSVMTSLFTPVDYQNHPYTLKSTTTSQEWCGHSFTQLNLDGNNYRFKQFSYFEAESDEEKKIDAALFEAELMTRIRLNKGNLPTGELTLIPSTIHARFAHQDLRPSKAQISKTQSESKTTYTIEYFHQTRTITIEVEQAFPYKILAWSENNGDGLLTTARLKKSLHTPYWSQNDKANEGMRMVLELVK